MKVDQEKPDATKPIIYESSVNPPEKPREPTTKPIVVDSSHPTVNGKVKKDSPTENKKSGEASAAKPKVVATASKTNGRNVLHTTPTQSSPPKGTRNVTSNKTTQNRTGAASSPSQINKASRSDNKTTVNNGRTNYKATVQSTGSSVAVSSHNRPAPPPPKGAIKRERVQGNPSVPTQSLPPLSTAERVQGKPSVPTQSLPPSTAAKHNKVQGNLSSVEKTRDIRTQKNTNGVSYKTKNGAVNL